LTKYNVQKGGCEAFCRKLGISKEKRKNIEKITYWVGAGFMFYTSATWQPILRGVKSLVPVVEAGSGVTKLKLKT
jgi:hypothetical protein